MDAPPNPKITQIPCPGSSGTVPTGALRFRDDWPGLFVRGDEAMYLAFVIKQLQERLANHPDAVVAKSLRHLQRYAEIVRRDVVVGEVKWLGSDSEQ